MLTFAVIVITLMTFSFVITPSILSPKLLFPSSTSSSSTAHLSSVFSPAYAQGVIESENNGNNAISTTNSTSSTNATADEEEEQQLSLNQTRRDPTGGESGAGRSSVSENATVTREGVLDVDEALLAANVSTDELALYAAENATVATDKLGTDSLAVPADPLAPIAAAPLSDGVYRIPYLDGTEVFVSKDHLSHDPPNRLDLRGTNGDSPYAIVAAADGIIRRIVDHFDINCTSNAGLPTGTSCTDYNNYVWIEHPNGEWTKYSHFVTDSVRDDAELSEGDFVSAGTFLGYEGNIGFAHSVHLHFEVGVPYNPSNPWRVNSGITSGFINGENRVPVICDIPNNIFVEDETYTAEDCSWASSDLNLRFSGLFLRTTDPSFLVGGEWNSFTSQVESTEDATATDFSSNWTYGLSRITDIETHLAAGNRYYTGIFRPEGGAETQIAVGLDWKSLQDGWNPWTSSGLDPIDTDAYTLQDGTVRHSVVLKQGSDHHFLVPPAEWWQFTFMWDQLSDQDWRLTDVEDHIEGANILFSGVFRAGGGGYGFFVHETLAELVDTWDEMRSLGRELINFEVTDTASGNRFYTGVFLTSSDNYRLWYGADWDNFEQTIASMRENGYELDDLEVSIGGDDVVDPTAGADDFIPRPQQGGGVCIDQHGNEHIATHSDQDSIDGIITGSNSDDVIVGSSVRDVIYGMGGNDIICGGYGDDSIDAGSGDDGYVSGEGGNDRIRGGEGDDFLFGGTDDDHIDGNSGENVLEGESGDDLLDGGAFDPPGNIIFGGDGTDNCANFAYNEGHECELLDEGVPELFFP